MRDLAARLRDIVRQSPRRELTYVPGEDAGETETRSLAETLGGRALGGDGACVELDRVYESDWSYGRRNMDGWRPASGAPLHLIRPSSLVGFRVVAPRRLLRHRDHGAQRRRRDGRVPRRVRLVRG